MGERATKVHVDLSSDQRARLCIASELIDVSNTELDGFDLLRYAHWVSTGQHPDGGPVGVLVPAVETEPVKWKPAVM